MKDRILNFIRTAVHCQDMDVDKVREGFDLAMDIASTPKDSLIIVGDNYVSLGKYKISINDYLKAYFLINEGKWILAIKALRSVLPLGLSVLPLGLKEAKDMVENAELFPAMINIQG